MIQCYGKPMIFSHRVRDRQRDCKLARPQFGREASTCESTSKNISRATTIPAKRAPRRRAEMRQDETSRDEFRFVSSRRSSSREGPLLRGSPLSLARPPARPSGSQTRPSSRSTKARARLARPWASAQLGPCPHEWTGSSAGEREKGG